MRLTDIRRIPPISENAAIALIVPLICAASWYGAHAFEARAERPIIVARSAPPFVSRKAKQDRVEPQAPDVIQPRPVPTTPYLLVPGREATLTGAPVRIPWSCTLLRRAADEFGRDKVRRFLREKGHTKAEIDEAMACLPGKKT